MIWGPVLRKLALVLLVLCAAGVLAGRMGLLRLEGSSTSAGSRGDAVPSAIALDTAIDPSGGIAAAVSRPAGVQSTSGQRNDAANLPLPQPTAGLPDVGPLVAPTATPALPPAVPTSPPPQPPLRPPPPPPHLPMCETELKTDRPGHDISTPSQESSATACCARCSDTPSCRAFTFVHDSSTCWLKGGPIGADGHSVTLPPGVSSACCTSGLVPGVAVYGAGSASGHKAAAIAAEDVTRKGAAALRGGDVANMASWKPPSMVIAIPTIPRNRGTANVDYLTGTVQSLVREALQVAAQHPSNLFGYVEILVLSHVDDDKHPDFVALRTKYAGAESVGRVPLEGGNGLGELRLRFLSDGGAARNLDPHKDDQPPVDDRKNPEDRPGVRVRQQSKDVIALIMAAEKVAPDYVLFTEDDAELCPGTLPKVASAIEHANRLTALSGAVRTILCQRCCAPHACLARPLFIAACKYRIAVPNQPSWCSSACRIACRHLLPSCCLLPVRQRFSHSGGCVDGYLCPGTWDWLVSSALFDWVYRDSGTTSIVGVDERFLQSLLLDKAT